MSTRPPSNPMKSVTEEEMNKFIKRYPRKLVRDVFTAVEPPRVTYNDHTLGDWPASVVASYNIRYHGGGTGTDFAILDLPPEPNPTFYNYAGRDDVDAELRQELVAAGIDVLDLPVLKAMSKSEVVTSIVGSLHGWSFKRAWRYWTAQGPGLPLTYATPLHDSFGKEVRVAGHCGCPSPLEWYKGFAVGDYHIDTPAGLEALADALKACYNDAHPGV